MSTESTRGKPPMSGPEMDDMALRGGRDACAALAKKGLEAGADHMDIAAEEFCASRLETMRSRLRTQREVIWKVQGELTRIAYASGRTQGFGPEIMAVVAALDEILKEEGP